MLTGDYEGLLPAFTKIKVKQFVLEYATPRAGDVHVVGKALSEREIGLGVVNPRTAEPESVEEIVAKAEQALEYFSPGQMFLNPDCGFGCFANRCVNKEEVAVRKIHRIAEAAAVLKEKHG